MLVQTADDLGLLIRARRRELGLDQKTLAEQVGVSRLWIIEFEKGKPTAEIGLVMRTLIALGLSLDVVVTPKTRSGADIDAIVERARKA